MNRKFVQVRSETTATQLHQRRENNEQRLPVQARRFSPLVWGNTWSSGSWRHFRR